jgi:hypothetical protein
MRLTPLYTEYLQRLAEQEQMALLLAGAVVIVAANLYFLRERRWWRLAAAAFWSSLFVLAIVKLGEAHWRPVSLGLLLDDPLWYDEAFTWAVARLPLDRLMKATAGDVHPPTWYVITHWTMKILGDAEWALRLPALLCGIAALAMTYKFGRAMGYEDKAALWAVALLAVLPGQMNYMQEARMYTLLQASVLAAALGIVTGRLPVMALGMAMALYAHNLAPIYVAVLAAFSIWKAWPDRQRLVRTVAWGAAAFAAWLPWLRVMLRQARDVGNGFWIVDHGIGGYLFKFGLSLTINQPDSLKLHLYLVFIAMIILATWYCWRRRRWQLLALAFGPAMLLAAVSEAWRPVFLGRALVPSLPFLALSTVGALKRLPHWARSPVLAVLVPMLALSLIWPVKQGVVDGDFLTDAIDDHYRNGDVVYHANLATYITSLYYARDAEQAVWADAGNLDQALTLETQRAMGLNRAEAADLLDQHHRLLVVWLHNPMSTADEVRELHAALALGPSNILETWPGNELVNVALWEVLHAKPKVTGAKDEKSDL